MHLLLFLLHVACSSSTASDTYTLTLLDTAKYPLATCLDGTPGAFYTSPGQDTSKWVIHLQGGAWCALPRDCASRALTPLGSSSAQYWPRSASCPPGGTGSPFVCSFDGGNGGLFSSNATVNPLMSTWSKAFAVYCDGGSFSGSVAEPVAYLNQTLYYRGVHILDAIIATLLTDFGAASATDFVLNGNSAGGLAVYLHADRVAAQLRAASPAVRVTALPDSGAFMDVESYYGNRNMLQIFQQTYSSHNASVNAACLASKNASSAWMCFYAQYTLPHITTPLFVAQSFGDSWQMGAIMRLPCPLHECWTNATLWALVQPYVTGFRQQMLQALQPVLDGTGPHGAFIAGCCEHGLAAYDGAWDRWAVGNQSMAQTFAAWYSRDAALPHSLVEGPWPVPWSLPNPTCKYYATA